jgi:uncharacterized membrane protein YccC
MSGGKAASRLLARANATSGRSNADIQIFWKSPHHNAVEWYASELLSSKKQHSTSIGENERTLNILREAFAAITNRLTPEVEPATIYLPYAPVSQSEQPDGKAE